MASRSKIGACGIACFKCPLLIAAKCLGCRPNSVCPLPKCASEKKVRLCFECGEFPCQKNYQAGPIVKELLDYFKKKKKKIKS